MSVSKWPAPPEPTEPLSRSELRARKGTIRLATLSRLPLVVALSLVPFGLIVGVAGMIVSGRDPTLGISLIVVGVACFPLFLGWAYLVLAGDMEMPEGDQLPGSPFP